MDLKLKTDWNSFSFFNIQRNKNPTTKSSKCYKTLLSFYCERMGF